MFSFANICYLPETLVGEERRKQNSSFAPTHANGQVLLLYEVFFLVTANCAKFYLLGYRIRVCGCVWMYFRWLDPPP